MEHWYSLRTNHNLGIKIELTPEKQISVLENMRGGSLSCIQTKPRDFFTSGFTYIPRG